MRAPTTTDPQRWDPGRDLLEDLVDRIAGNGRDDQAALGILRALVSSDRDAFDGMEPVVKAMSVDPALLWALRDTCVAVRAEHRFRGIRYLRLRGDAVRAWALTVPGVDTRPFVRLLEQTVERAHGSAHQLAMSVLAGGADAYVRGLLGLSVCDAALQGIWDPPNEESEPVPVPAMPPKTFGSVVVEILVGAVLGGFSANVLATNGSGNFDLRKVVAWCVAGALSTLVLGSASGASRRRFEETAHRAAVSEYARARAARDSRAREMAGRWASAQTWRDGLRRNLRDAMDSAAVESIRAVIDLLDRVPEVFIETHGAAWKTRLDQCSAAVAGLLPGTGQELHMAGGSDDARGIPEAVAQIAAQYRRSSGQLREMASQLELAASDLGGVSRIPAELLDVADALGETPLDLDVGDEMLDLIWEMHGSRSRGELDDGSATDAGQETRGRRSAAYGDLMLAAIRMSLERLSVETGTRMSDALSSLRAAADRCEASQQLDRAMGALVTMADDLEQVREEARRATGLQTLTVIGGAVGLAQVADVKADVAAIRRGLGPKR